MTMTLMFMFLTLIMAMTMKMMAIPNTVVEMRRILMGITMDRFISMQQARNQFCSVHLYLYVGPIVLRWLHHAQLATI